MSELGVMSAAAGISAMAVYAAALVARRLGLVSTVQVDRWHRHGDIPRLSGPALLLALTPWLSMEQLVVLGGFCMVGTIDDIRRVGPGTKSLLLVLPCAIAAWMAGSLWLALAYWWVVNAMNLLDHADGLASSAAGGSLAVAGGITGFAGAGACIGFLVHNFPPARIFLGDSGSMLLGALMVSTWSTHGPLSLALGVAVPMADLIFVALRRVLGGRKPWVGGIDHTGHVLLRAGVPPRLLPLLYAGLAALVAFLGCRGW
jgi:UDP-GlcNAc:undecaprenyl-phosphate GlcNAc-1-phosphate transferase